MMIRLIFIHKKDFLEVKIGIYHQTIKVITKDMFKSLLLCILVWLEIALKKPVVEGILKICIDKSVWQCHLIITGMSIDYKE